MKKSTGEVKVYKLAEFGFGHYENAERVVMAFAQSGYFTRMRKESAAYVVEIYSFNPTS